MINVVISAGSWAKVYLKGTSKAIPISKDTSAFDAAVSAGIPADEVGVLTIDNVKINDDYKLSGGETVFVYPQIIGG